MGKACLRMMFVVGLLTITAAGAAAQSDAPLIDALDIVADPSAFDGQALVMEGGSLLSVGGDLYYNTTGVNHPGQRGVFVIDFETADMALRRLAIKSCDIWMIAENLGPPPSCFTKIEATVDATGERVRLIEARMR